MSEANALLADAVDAPLSDPSGPDPINRDIGLSPADFSQFKQFLTTQPSVPPAKREKLANITPTELYSLSSEFGISDNQGCIPAM